MYIVEVRIACTWCPGVMNCLLLQIRNVHWSEITTNLSATVACHFLMNLCCDGRFSGYKMNFCS